MGRAYGRDLLKAAADSLARGASVPWDDVVSGKAINRKAFDDGIRAAMGPLANEQAARFGEATSDPLDPSKASAVRSFWRDLASGIREVSE